GERVENPDAVSLPLNLAIALLKDSKGQINIDLPITGSLDDPEFSVGTLVMRALGNLIRNIATSPFRAIASMFGAEQDLSAITFEPGSTIIAETEQAKLDALAQALKDRLALRLEIRGAAFEALDWPALRSEALNDQLKSMRAKELRAEGRRIRAEYVTLSEDEEQRLLAQLFIEKFPMLADYTFFGRPRLKNPEQGDFYEIARQTLEAALEPDQQRLNDLAVRRAGAIQNYLIAEGGIPGNRIFLLATELNPVRKEPGITATLSLGTR
ncbi:MAG TPA: membrane biogenesis protein, partial [Methylococcaceae bacterium]|nr:membrane biogenesis protein [Methylococcaceae bacterium]